MLDIITDSHIACSPYLTMAAGSSSKLTIIGVPLLQHGIGGMGRPTDTMSCGGMCL